MITSPFNSHDESLRLSALLKLGILDTPREERFDRITRLAQRLFEVPIAIVGLVDRNRQWFKSCVGIDLIEIPREFSFCEYTIIQEEPLVIPDTLLDSRFVANPFVVSDPNVRFYAGQTLFYEGLAIGSVCVLDQKPRQFSQADRAALQDIAILVQNELGVDQLKVALQERQQAENELYRSEQQFRALAENSPDAIARVDREGRYVYVNPAFKQAINKPFQLSLDQAPIEAAAVENTAVTPVWLESVKKVVETGQPHSYEVEYQPANGNELRYYHVSSSPEFAPDGKVEYVLGVARDITEIKLAEIKLRESEQLSATLFKTAPVSLAMLHLPDGLYLEVNDRFVELRGYSREEVIGHSGREFGWADANKQVQLLKEITKQETVSNWEYEVRTKSGEIIYGLVNSEKIVYKGEMCALITFVDITERRRIERELHQTQAQLATLFQTVPVAISVVRMSDGVYLEVNHSLTHLLGYSREDVIGSSVAKYGGITLQDQERLLQALRQHGSVAGFECQIRNYAREIRFGYINATIITYHGEACVLSSFIDATEIRRLELELDESQDRFVSLFQIAPVSLTLIRLSDGVYLEINDTLLKNSGYQREDVVGHTNSDLGWSSSQSTEQLRLILQERGQISNLEYEVIRVNGERRQGYINANIINYNGELCLISSFFDATELHRLETELQESHKRLQTMLDNLPVTLFSINRDGIITMSNGNGLIAYARKPNQGVGSSIFNHFSSAPETRDWWERILSGQPVSGVVKYRDTCLDAHFVPTFDVQGAVNGAFGVTLNVTERVQAEEELRRSEEKLLQSQKMEAIGRLAGGVAHDFNNLLTAILGYADLLSFELDESNPNQEFVTGIKTASERAASLTRQLLAFSRKQMLQPKTLDLNTIVSGAVTLLYRLIGERVEIVSRPGPELGLVKADPNQLEQVLVNLAVNARDALEPKGGGQLIIETQNVVLDEDSLDKQFKATPGPYVLLSVSDNGVGMDAETSSRIFEPFFTTKEVGRGTGLGLSTVYGIIKQSNGYILTYSTLGVGTTFKIYLPRITNTAFKEDVAATVRPLLPVGTETILVVEDEESVRNLIRKILSKHGYKVLVANRGQAALQICQNYPDPIKLVVTDVIMPEMTGPELSYQLRTLRPDTKILFISGYSDQNIFDNGVLEMQAGSAYLEKPFTTERLVRKLRELLENT